MEHDAIVLPALMLGLSGFVVLAAAEYGGELQHIGWRAQSVVGLEPFCQT
ncbi:MAG TPA: hypothetical protein VE462_01935 [Propionibacteriaceae bacterium]|nr:hypothetical protein [Propionibacteriaceae bacterium]